MTELWKMGRVLKTLPDRAEGVECCNEKIFYYTISSIIIIISVLTCLSVKRAGHRSFKVFTGGPASTISLLAKGQSESAIYRRAINNRRMKLSAMTCPVISCKSKSSLKSWIASQSQVKYFITVNQASHKSSIWRRKSESSRVPHLCHGLNMLTMPVWLLAS